MTHNKSFARRLLRGSTALPALMLIEAGLLASPAIAQEVPAATANTDATVAVTADPAATSTDSTEGEIIVTGSRISRPDLEASSPVAIIGAEQLRDVNTVTVEQILNANPQFVASNTSASNNPGTGVATVDLRGLGSKRTLVLIDGKRAPPYDPTGVVDVNIIPTALIKRVDILTGGASAVYGSDAISGVVNFVLNDRFAGLQADASAQVSKYGDATLYNVSLTGGMKFGDRGNIVVSGGYSERSAVYFGARPYTAGTIDAYDELPTGSGNTVPTVFDVPGLDDAFQVLPNGGLTTDVQLYGYNPVNYAQLPFSRYNIMGLARYELTDNIEAYARASYAKIKVATNLAATATAGFSFNLDQSNPFLSAAERDAFFNTVANPGLLINDGTSVGGRDPTARPGTSVIGIRRRIIETGGRLTNTTNKNQQYVGGLRGDLGNFNWDVFAQWGKTKREQILRNDLSYTALTQALDVVAGPSGAPACFDPSNGCVPLNVFNVGIIPQESLAFVLRNALSNDSVTQFVTGANLNGDLAFLQSPWAASPAAISVGVEYRKEKASTVVDDNYASGDLIYYGQGQNVSGKYDVKEIYGEIKIPLVQDRPGIKSLGLEAGIRYSDYSTVGGVKTYKLGGDYSPFDGLRFRSIYQRAVRAPNIYELFSPVVAATGGLSTDPCATSPVSPAVAAECIRQGAPPGRFSGGAGGGTSSVPQPISGQINIFYGGNPGLSEETSDTFTAGVVFSPKLFRGFSGSIDYYKIKIADAIAAISPSSIVNACFSNPSAANPACGGIVRSPINGSLSGNTNIGLPAGLGNVSAISTEGVDFAATYAGGDRNAMFYRIYFNGTWLRSFKVNDDQCAGRFGPQCDFEPLPKWRHVVDATIGFSPVSFTTRWRYLGSTKADPFINGDEGDAIANLRIKAYSYFDETVNFDISDRYSLRLGVLNLFNKKPPFIGENAGPSLIGGNTYPNTYDVIGRSFFASVTAKLF